MQLPLQIHFHDVPATPAIKAEIQRRADKLNEFYDRITGCRVVVDAPHKHQQTGRIYNVRIDITVPGQELVVNRDTYLNQAHSDLLVAIGDAFRAAERRLRSFAGRLK
jgi:ribosomal subunit interface protein